MKQSIEDYTEYLLNCNSYDDSFDAGSNNNHLRIAKELFENYQWNEIYPVWAKYLYSKCDTAEEVMNFANQYIYYGASDYPIPNPYEFLGYLFYKVDIDKYWQEASDLFDAISVDVLEACKIVSMWSDPYYSPFKDEKILKAVEEWKNKNK